MAIIRYPDTDIENERRDNHEKNNQKVSTQIDQIKIQMRKELSIGDYA